ncbi:MAG: ComEC/Rec2 family competence protein [Clostridia bacterium]|nr:ComEC/Rec2 family competence protein [Clostridia bacterium]
MAVSLFLLFIWFLFRGKKKTFHCLLCLFLCLSFFSGLLFCRPYTAAKRISEKEESVSFTAVLTEHISDEQYTATVTAANGEVCRIPVFLILKGEETPKAGDVLQCKGEWTRIYSPGNLWEDGYGLSEGVTGTIRLSDYAVVGHNFSPKALTGALRERLVQRLYALVPGGGSLYASLLLGDKSVLPGSFCLSFERLGLSHMLSISGLHLNTLAFGLMFLQKNGRTGKKVRIFTLAGFSVTYIFLTGLTKSVLRAGFMLIICSVSPVFGGTHVCLSALAFAVCLICLFSPGATLSLGLWLSALATGGIQLAFFGYRSTENPVSRFFRETELTAENLSGKPSLFRVLGKRLLKWAFFSALVTASASLATLPLTALTFGTFSLLSLPANLIFSPIVSLALYTALFVLVFGNIPFIGILAGWEEKAVFALANFLGRTPGCLVSVRHPVCRFIILISCTFLFAYLLLTPKGKLRGKIILAAVAIAVGCTGCVNGISGLSLGKGLSVTYNGQIQDLFVLRDRNGFSAIGSTCVSPSCQSKTLALLHGMDCFEIQEFLLLGYSDSIAEGLSDLMGSVRIGCLYVPAPSPEEQDCYERIASVAAEYGTALRVLAYGKEVSVRGGQFTLQRSYSGQSNRIHGFTLQKSDRTLGYFSGDMMTSPSAYGILETLPGLDFAVFGSDAPVTVRVPLWYPQGKTAFICKDYRFFPFTGPNLSSYTITDSFTFSLP